MGIVNKAGNRPFSKRQAIHDEMRQARVQFAKIAADVGLAIFRNYIPIDTGELREVINAYVVVDVAIIEVPSRVIHYQDAKKLAITLNIGLSEAGRILIRRKSNRGKGTSKGDPTARWIENAIAETRQKLQPIGQRLINEAANRALEGMING